MRTAVIILFILSVTSCKKAADMSFPGEEPQLVVEMYLEDGRQYRCLLSETLPYTSTSASQLVSNASVLLSDGEVTDSLAAGWMYDYETGRKYNYLGRGIYSSDTIKTFTLTITDSLNRTIRAVTQTPKNYVKLDSIYSQASLSDPEAFSVGFSFSDPVSSENYYRVVIGKGVNNYNADNTDMLLSDIAFDGERYNYSSEAAYSKGDTVTVRLYFLQPDHFNYLHSIEGARSAISNPFVQPSSVQSNIEGGTGIFAVIRYDERYLIIR